MHHAAVAVLYEVSRLAVDAAGADAVGGEEVRVQRARLAVPPRRGQIHQLENRHESHSEAEQTHIRVQQATSDIDVLRIYPYP